MEDSIAMQSKKHQKLFKCEQYWASDKHIGIRGDKLVACWLSLPRLTKRLKTEDTKFKLFERNELRSLSGLKYTPAMPISFCNARIHALLMPHSASTVQEAVSLSNVFFCTTNIVAKVGYAIVRLH